MMAVIVIDADAVPATDMGEAPLHAAKALKRRADSLVIYTHLHGNTDSGEAVQHVVRTVHGEPDAIHLALLAALAIGDRHIEHIEAVLYARIGRANVGLRIGPIGHNSPVTHAADHRLHFGMIDAHHGGAIEGHILDKGQEGILRRLERAVVVEMLGVDIGNDCKGCRQLDERTVGLIRLDHHPLALAKPRIGAIGVDDAAIDDSRVESYLVENCRHHRSRCRLAMCTGNRDAALEAHQLGEHFRATHDRKESRPRFYQLRVFRPDRRRHDDHLRILEIPGLLADENLDAKGLQPLHIGAVGKIASLHLVAEIVHHFGDTAHADTTDAGEVNCADVEWRRTHHAPLGANLR